MFNSFLYVYQVGYIIRWISPAAAWVSGFPWVPGQRIEQAADARLVVQAVADLGHGHGSSMGKHKPWPV